MTAFHLVSSIFRCSVVISATMCVNLRSEPDGGTTNIRRTDSKHWRPWLEPANRVLVPFTSFSARDPTTKENVCSAADKTRPLLCFAGVWTNWTSVRKIKEGPVTLNVFGFLTTDANAG